MSLLFNSLEKLRKLIRSGKTAIIVSVALSALAQMLLLRTSYLQLEKSEYQRLVQVVSFGSIVYIFILGPVVTVISLSEASDNFASKSKYTLTSTVVRKMRSVLLFFLGLLLLTSFLFGEKDLNNATFTVMLYLVTGYQFSFNRGLFMGRKQWLYVAKQLLAESAIKASLVLFLLVSHSSNSVMFFTCIWLPQFLVNCFSGKDSNVNSVKLIDKLNSKTIKTSFSILGSIWISSMAGIATSSIPILLTSFNKNFSSEDISNLANIFFVCRLPLSLSGAVFGPMLVQFVSGERPVNSQVLSTPVYGSIFVLLFSGMTVFNLMCIHILFGNSYLSNLLNIAILTLSTMVYLLADILTMFSIRDQRYKSLKICWATSMTFMVIVLLSNPEAQLIPVVVLISSLLLVALLFGDRAKQRKIYQ